MYLVVCTRSGLIDSAEAWPKLEQAEKAAEILWRDAVREVDDVRIFSDNGIACWFPPFSGC